MARGPEAGENEEEWAERVADEVVTSGQRFRLVPARGRRIDEGIARCMRDRGVAWPPPELAALDRNPEPSRPSDGEATAAAVTTVLRGGADITPQGIGDLLRANQPTGWGNPWASLAEYTIDDVPDLAQEVFRPDGGMSTAPDGPVRDTLLRLVKAAPLDDLREAWAASGGDPGMGSGFVRTGRSGAGGRRTGWRGLRMADEQDPYVGDRADGRDE